MGRKTKLDEEMQDRIAAALRLGYYQEQAAIMAGVSPSTYYDWLKRGTVTDENPDPQEPFAAFAIVVAEARAEAEGYYINIIRTAAGDSWQAAAWFLERSYPARWGRKERIEHVGSDADPVVIKLTWPEDADT